MRGKTPETCASCRHFPRQAIESGEPHDCRHRELVVAWNHRACVLHSHCIEDERKIRRRLVEAQDNTNTEKGNT